jgi:hypothetical protein
MRLPQESPASPPLGQLNMDYKLSMVNKFDLPEGVGYLLEQMEMEAQKRGKLADFIDMLRLLQTRTQTELESR